MERRIYHPGCAEGRKGRCCLRAVCHPRNEGRGGCRVRHSALLCHSSSPRINRRSRKALRLSESSSTCQEGGTACLCLSCRHLCKPKKTAFQAPMTSRIPPLRAPYQVAEVADEALTPKAPGVAMCLKVSHFFFKWQGGAHVVALQVAFERQILKPVFHLIGFRLWV